MNQSKLSSLTGRRLDAALALLDSDAAAAALDEREQQTLARRRALAADWAAIASQQGPAAKAASAYTGAVLRRVSAQAALAAAWRLEAAAMGDTYAAQYSADRAANTIAHELTESADDRLGRMLYLLNLIDDNARAKLSFYAMSDPTRPGLRAGFADNMADVKAARRIIVDCEAQCKALQHDAITYAAATDRLGTMCAALAGPMAQLEMNPPQLGEDGTLEAPLPWGATGSLTRWRVEAAVPQPRQLEPITERGG